MDSTIEPSLIDRTLDNTPPTSEPLHATPPLRSSCVEEEVKPMPLFNDCLASNAQRLNQLKRFIVTYDNTLSFQVQQEIVLSFVDLMVGQSVKDPLFAAYMNHPAYSLETLIDNWEKLILTKIHHLVFAQKNSHDER